MPTQIAWGSSLQFNVSFLLSSVGQPYTPSQANVNLDYTAYGGGSTSETVALTLGDDGYTFSGVWPSTASKVGQVSWYVTTDSTLSAGSGTIRLTGPT